MQRPHTQAHRLRIIEARCSLSPNFLLELYSLRQALATSNAKDLQLFSTSVLFYWNRQIYRPLIPTYTCFYWEKKTGKLDKEWTYL